MINFPLQPLPQGRPIRPLEQPQHYDPASIIMQAAALRQQRDIVQAQQQQKSVEDFLSAINAAGQLAEHKREFDTNNAMAQATLAMQQGKFPLEEAQLMAHTGFLQAQQKLAEAQAGAFSGTGNGPDMEMVHQHKKDYNEWLNQFSSRNMQRSAMATLYAINYPNDNPATLHQEYQKNLTAASAMGQQAPTVGKIDSLFTQINRFDKLASLVPKSSMDMINAKGLNISAAGFPGEDPLTKTHASNLLQQTRILSDEAQSTFGNGSDAKLALGGAIFDPNPNPATIMSQNQIARYSLLSRRNSLAGAPDSFVPPSFNGMPPSEPVSSYLNRMKMQGIPATSVIPVVHQMVNSGLLNDDLTGQ